MSVGLRPMRDDEFDAWRRKSQGGYADDMHRNAGMTREAADAKAERDYDSLLSAGLGTPDHFVHVIEDDGEGVGSLWTAIRDTPSGRALFVFEVQVDEAARGRGLGRAAMVDAERLAREHGLGRIELNVMGGNQVARGLYRSLGYAEVAVYMGKTL